MKGHRQSLRCLQDSAGTSAVLHWAAGLCWHSSPVWSVSPPVSGLSLTGQESVCETPTQDSYQIINHTTKLSSSSGIPLQYWSAVFYENPTAVSFKSKAFPHPYSSHTFLTSIGHWIDRSLPQGPSLVSLWLFHITCHTLTQQPPLPLRISTSQSV